MMGESRCSNCAMRIKARLVGVDHRIRKPYMKNNYVYIVFLSLFILTNVALFVSRLYEYRAAGPYVMLARAFTLVLMLRQCMTFLRTHGFSSVLPLDQHIYLHKMVGVLIGVFSVVHTVMHLINFGETMSEWLLTSRPGLFGLVGGGANPTGVALLVILVVMSLCSMPFVRRGGCFEWFVLPGAIYFVERVRRLAWLRSQRGKTYISSGLLLPSKVTHLVIKRPHHFDFRPGDYVFVNVPVIARYEWHPFTISSAPEQEDYMWLHIRAVGEWTNSLYTYFDKEQQKLHRGEVLPIEGLQPEAPRKPSIPKPKQTPLIIKKEASSESLEDPRGLDNPRFVGDNGKTSSSNPTINTQASYLAPPPGAPELARSPRDRKLHQLLLGSKMPLEKSFSMPDMQTKHKKRQRLIALRDYTRSESERSFDECQIRRARLKSLGLAYLSPQNKSLAQSFRYMRTKPTIIAFKTPSLENCEYEVTPGGVVAVAKTSSAEKVATAPPVSLAAAAEEGRLGKKPELEDRKTSLLGMGKNQFYTHPAINYPVGKPLEIFLDGPYGAPSSHIFQAQHAVLIATGIGVTPFASILQSIMHRYWKARHTCPQCQFSWASEIPPTVMNLRKVDFFWINRDQQSFEWFVNLLSQLEMEQAELGVTMERFLEMHMYITSALQKNDMKAVGLQLAMDLLHEKEKRDLITGLKTRTNAGRPNWDKVFKQLQDRKKGKVTVFYCGPPQLGKILRYKCDQFGFNFRKETF